MAESQSWAILKLSSNDRGFKNYEAFVFQTWLRTYRRFNHHLKEIPEKLYFEHYKRILQNILARPHAVIALAVLPDDFDVILGWAIYEDQTLHYVFTKADCQARLKGIAKSLIPENINQVSHLTSFGRMILKNHKNIIYNPFEAL